MPVVASPLACEGMGLEHERELLVAGEPAAFAAAVLRLCQDRDLWRRLSQAGPRFIQERHSKEVVKQKLASILNESVAAPNRPRKAFGLNFLGAGSRILGR